MLIIATLNCLIIGWKAAACLYFPPAPYVWLSLSLSLCFLALLYFFSDVDENVRGLLLSEDMFV